MSGVSVAFHRFFLERAGRPLFAPLSGSIPAGAKVGVVAPNQQVLEAFFGALRAGAGSVQGLVFGSPPSESNLVLAAYPEEMRDGFQMREFGKSLESSSATHFCATLHRAILEDSVEMILELDTAFSRILRGNFTLWSSECGVCDSTVDPSLLRRRLRRGEYCAPVVASDLDAAEKRRLLEEHWLPERILERIEKEFGLTDWVSVGTALREQLEDESVINYLGFDDPSQLISQAAILLRHLGFVYSDLMCATGDLSGEMRRRAAIARALLLASGSPPLLLEYPECGTTLPFLNYVGGLLATRRSATVVITDEQWLRELFDPVGLERDEEWCVGAGSRS